MIIPVCLQRQEKSLDIEETVTEIAEICNNYGIIILPIKTRYLERIQQLPLIHGDPFDRLIMSAALEEGLCLITCDSNIRKYDIELLW